MKFLLVFLSAGLLLLSCSKGQPVSTATTFAKGADISWLTEMEDRGIKFLNGSGQQEDLFLILKGLGMNTIRLRVWVNPTDGYNGVADVLKKAVRAKNAGMDVLVDFHYSDTWADPAHQAPPIAWQGLGVDDLKQKVGQHTKSVLSQLKNAGVSVKWVQVGNETNDGMLWPVGKASANMASFASIINSGYEAVKSVYPQAQVIVHLSNGFDNSLFTWMFDGLAANGAHWDVIGMSLYPTVSNWQQLNQQCLTNMINLVQHYGKPVMVTEVGMPWDQPDICNQFLADLIQKVKSIPVNKGLGVLYWEPESYNNWKGYTLGAFDNSGKPTRALDAFQ